MLLFWSIGQNAQCQKIQIGIHSGHGRAQLSNFWDIKNDAWGADWVKSPMSGAGFSYYFKNRFALGIEVNYVRKGNIRYGLENRYHYLHLPMLVKYDFFKNQRGNFLMSVRLGGYASFLQKQTQKFSEETKEEIFLLEYSSVSDFDYGLTVGVGAGIRLDDNIFLNLELRGERGLAHVFDVSFAYAKKNIVNISGWCLFGLTYTFPSTYEKQTPNL